MDNENKESMPGNNPEQAPKKEGLKLLPRLILHPVSCGPVFVSEHHPGAFIIAILLHALSFGFYNMTLFRNINDALLKALLALGSRISDGLGMLSGDLIDMLKTKVIDLVSQIPLIGDSIAETATQFITDTITDFSNNISVNVSAFLDSLYNTVELPEKNGFIMAFGAVIIGTFAAIIMMMLILLIAGHPYKSFPKLASLVAIKSTISFPIILLSTIIMMFSPVIGALISPLAFLFGVSYVFSVLMVSAVKGRENRLAILFPIIFIILLILEIITVVVVLYGAGSSIYSRFSEFLQHIDTYLLPAGL